jgi:autophagy-related protein 13
MPGYNEADEGSGDSGVIATNGPSRDAVKKLDQIIQVAPAAILLPFGRC